MPNKLINGRPTSTDDDPVIAKTIKILMSSHRALTIHLLSNFSIQNTHNFRNTRPLANPTNQNNHCETSKNLAENLKPI